jgi:RND family efflux transporter MFP subunit
MSAPLLRPLATVLPFVLAACGTAAPPAGPAPVPVSAVTVGAPTAGGEEAVFSATIRRDREANLSFRVGGTVAEAPARIGQELPAGALVAALDPTAYRAGVARQGAEVARLERAAGRYAGLVEAGAVADASARDARDALAGARAGLTAARFDLAGTRLVMPFRGVVLSRQVERGETVGGGQVVATVADLGAPLLATAQVTATAATRLRPGTPATIAAEGAAPLAGRVLRVSGGSDPRSGTVAVEVALPGAARLPSGTPVSVRFALSPLAGGAAPAMAPVAIPAEAVLAARGQRATVFVIDGQGRARRREVGFLGFDDRAARVSGLPAGTRVITAGAGFVAEGDRVVEAGA